MEILGSKQGSINRMGDSKLIKRNGVNVNLSQDLSKKELETSMKQLSEESIMQKYAIEAEKRIEREKNIEVAYKEWLNTDHSSAFVGVEPLLENHSIIKVFYYNEKPSSNVLILEDDINAYHKVFPIAKVVANNNPALEVNDLVSIPAVMCQTVPSKIWEQYQKDIREKPSLKNDIPEPPVYIGRLTEWLPYMYQIDPFSMTTIDDQHTFCVRSGLLLTKNKK